MARERICTRSSTTTRDEFCRGLSKIASAAEATCQILRDAAVQIEFYVTAHNQVMPHPAFEGQTPDEMYFGTGGSVVAELATARKAAREERMKGNRAAACRVCFVEADSTALLLLCLSDSLRL
jgi:hypothetical protein